MGVVPPKNGFLETLREVTNQAGAVLIFDEVITGFRVALGGAQSLYGVKPDLTCLGKSHRRRTSRRSLWGIKAIDG